MSERTVIENPEKVEIERVPAEEPEKPVEHEHTGGGNDEPKVPDHQHETRPEGDKVEVVKD